MTETTVTRLRQLEAQATPGPWRQERREVAVGGWEYGSVFIHDQDQEANAALIAAARNALPQLLDVVDAARAHLTPRPIWKAYEFAFTENTLRAALAALDRQETE
jgi:hypothetical protein